MIACLGCELVNLGMVLAMVPDDVFLLGIYEEVAESNTDRAVAIIDLVGILGISQ
jgi:hypothetical protein